MTRIRGNSRGFTLVELAVVASVAAVLMPLLFMFYRSVEASDREARALQQFTAAARTVSEELRRDLHAGVAGPGLSFTGDAACGAVTYARGDDGVFVRRTASCGERFVARDVAAVEVANGLVSLRFARNVGRAYPARAEFPIGLPGVTP